MAPGSPPGIQFRTYLWYAMEKDKALVAPRLRHGGTCEERRGPAGLPGRPATPEVDVPVVSGTNAPAMRGAPGAFHVSSRLRARPEPVCGRRG